MPNTSTPTTGNQLHTHSSERPKIQSPKDIFELMQEQELLPDQHQETCFVLCLDGNAQILNKAWLNLDKGGMDLFAILRFVAESDAASFILVHHHEAKNLRYSKLDLQNIKELKKAGKCIGSRLIDYILITNQGYLSTTG